MTHAEPRQRKDIQILRAISVALVIVYHFPARWNFEGGFVGVDIFFVISGFVVSRGLITAQSNPQGSATAYLAFLRRRLQRLLPALAVAVAGIVLLTLKFAPTGLAKTIPTGALSAQVFASNFYFLEKFDTYWNPEQLTNPLLHTWSLGVEFQVYLVLPLFFIFFQGRHQSAGTPSISRRQGLTISLVSALSLSAFLYLVLTDATKIYGFDPNGLAFYLPFPRIWEVLLGSLAAVAVVRPRPIAGSTLGYAVGLLLILTGTILSAEVATISPAVIPCCFGTAALLVFGNSFKWAYEPPRALTPLIWVGDRSYSLYLWHWPLLVLCGWRYPGSLGAIAIAVVSAIIAADLSFRFVESSGPRRRPLTRAFIHFGLAVSVIAVSHLVTTSKWFNRTKVIKATHAGLRDSALTGKQMLDAVAGCTSVEFRTHCDNTPGAGRELVIIGDSLAYRTFPVVQFIAKQRGFDASLMWRGGCGIEAESCPREYYDYIQSHETAGLIVAMCFDRASNRLNGVEVLANHIPSCEKGQSVKECAEHRKAVKNFKSRAKLGLPYLAGISSRVLMALPFPQQAYPFPHCLDSRYQLPTLDVTAAEADCGRTSRAWQAARQGLFPKAIRSVVSGVPGVELWDPQSFFCDKTWCPTFTQSREMVMTDSIHWSLEGSRFYYQPLEDFVSRIP